MTRKLTTRTARRRRHLRRFEARLGHQHGAAMPTTYQPPRPRRRHPLADPALVVVGVVAVVWLLLLANLIRLAVVWWSP